MTLTGTRLQQTARRTAAALPDVTHDRPFTPKLDVYKAAGKVFLIVTDEPAELAITVKCEPDRGSSLCLRYESITPGRYLSKAHWISVGAGPGITASLIEDLVLHSYDLVHGPSHGKTR
ncbi:MmcQ/YjbR family DNA-binding protein [Streptomyces sp. NPDC006261]|uniref:MmcQ/YjbR family DNA-binding protein n=1 Tax=Streptomyces sp. NPDC006261 TaxID=3156739 RepID=UPI0033B2EDBE